MNDDQDPRLKALFGKASQQLTGDQFIPRVMADIDRSRRRTGIVWAGVGLVLVALAVLLAPALAAAVSLLTAVLPVSLVDLDGHWMANLVAPANSIAGILGLLFLLLFAAIRKLSR